MTYGVTEDADVSTGQPSQVAAGRASGSPCDPDTSSEGPVRLLVLRS